MMKTIRQSDAQLRAEGATSIAYSLDPRFAGVMLPHKSNVKVRRQHPFSSLLEQTVHLIGGDATGELLADADFMSLQMPSPD